MKQQIGRLKRATIGYWQDRLQKPLAAHPQATHQTLGRSVQDREINYYRIGSGRQAVLFVGGIHGNEVGTVKLVYQLLNYLTEQQANYPTFTFHLIPCLNPDGYALARQSPDYWNGGRIGRFNANNVDLNRNFPTASFQSESVWTHGKNYQEKTVVFCGAKGGSEPETQALLRLVKQEKISTYFAFHTAARDVMGNETPLGQELAALFSQATGYRLSLPEEWHGLEQTGTAKEWSDEQGLAYLEIEATTRWGSDWQSQEAGIISCLECLKNSYNSTE